jgi:hypothetical protein
LIPACQAIETTQLTTGTPRSRRWDASLLVALASVLVALVFKALQVHGTARQLNQSQQNLAFTTLMNMSDRIAKADLDTTNAALLRASNQEKKTATRQTASLAAIIPLEGVVAALERHVVSVAGARELWTTFLVCDYREVRDQLKEEQRDKFDLKAFNAYLPRLAGFNARHPGKRECILGPKE